MFQEPFPGIILYVETRTHVHKHFDFKFSRVFCCLQYEMCTYSCNKYGQQAQFMSTISINKPNTRKSSSNDNKKSVIVTMQGQD